MITCPLCGASVAEIRRTAGREIQTIQRHSGDCVFGITPPTFSHMTAYTTWIASLVCR